MNNSTLFHKEAAAAVRSKFVRIFHKLLADCDTLVLNTGAHLALTEKKSAVNP